VCKYHQLLLQFGVGGAIHIPVCDSVELVRWHTSNNYHTLCICASLSFSCSYPPTHRGATSIRARSLYTCQPTFLSVCLAIVLAQMYIYKYIYTYMYNNHHPCLCRVRQIYTCIYIYIYMCIHIYITTNIPLCLSRVRPLHYWYWLLYMYVYMYIYIYVHIYIYIYIYTCVHVWYIHIFVSRWPFTLLSAMTPPFLPHTLPPAPLPGPDWICARTIVLHVQICFEFEFVVANVRICCCNSKFEHFLFLPNKNWNRTNSMRRYGVATVSRID